MKLIYNDKEFDPQTLLAAFIEDDETKFTLLTSPNLTFEDGMQLLQSLSHALLFAYAKQKPEAIEHIYYAYNMMASSLLNNLCPDMEKNKDLDADAILKAQAETLEKTKTSEEVEEYVKKKKEELRGTLSGDRGEGTTPEESQSKSKPGAMPKVSEPASSDS